MKTLGENKKKNRGVQTFTFTSTLLKLNPQGVPNDYWSQEYRSFFKKLSIIEASYCDMDNDFFDILSIQNN